MAKVKIKAKNSRQPETINKLLSLLSKHDIYATRVIPNNDGFVVLTYNDSELDKIFDGTTNNDLINNGFTPIIPLQLRANRSVVIFKVDNHIYQHPEDDMITEMEGKNEWIEKITQVYKSQQSNTLKITFSTTREAKKAQEVGIKLYSMRLPSYDVKQDKHHHINTCFKCYMLEDHFTNKCPRGETFKLCSECGVEGHVWRDCVADQKCCPNCRGPHSAMAMRCPMRKDILNEKRKEDKEKTEATYTATLKKNLPIPTFNLPTNDQPISDRHDRMYMCMLHAHYKNSEQPGTYSKVLNKMLTDNKLPTIIVEDNPPSQRILSAIYQQHDKTDKESMIEGATAKVTGPEIDKTEESMDDSEVEIEEVAKQRPKSTRRRSASHKGERSEPIKGLDVGLMIAAKKSEGWPRDRTKKKLLRGIEEKKYKFTYEDDALEEKDLLNLIATNSIDLTDCFMVLDDSIFDKIRSGLIRKSPSPNEYEPEGKMSKQKQSDQ